MPNLLTGLRLALAAVFPLLPPAARVPVVVAAGLSDGLDGWIARRFHAETALGRLLDGIADKAFVLAALLTLAAEGTVRWGEAALVLARDATVVGIAVWFAAQRRWEAFAHMKARGPGKATTALAFAWFVSVLLSAPSAVSTVAFVAAAAASALAAGDYLLQVLRVRRHLGGV